MTPFLVSFEPTKPILKPSFDKKLQVKVQMSDWCRGHYERPTFRHQLSVFPMLRKASPTVVVTRQIGWSEWHLIAAKMTNRGWAGDGLEESLW